MKNFMILCMNEKSSSLDIENVTGTLISFGCTSYESSDIIGKVLDDNIISELKCEEITETYNDWKRTNNEIVLYLADYDSVNGIKIMDSSNKRFRNQK